MTVIALSKTKEKIMAQVIEYIQNGIDVSKRSMADIAKEVGIGKSTMYEYFTSKEALIEEAYISLIHIAKEYLFEYKDMVDFESAFKEQMSVNIDFMKETLEFMEVVLRHQQALKNADSNKKIKSHITALQKEMDAEMSMIFKMGVKEGYYTNEELSDHHTKYILKALIGGLTHNYCTNQIPMTKDEFLDFLFESTLKNIQKK
jgi:AcrR family transcriptional regulator